MYLVLSLVEINAQVYSQHAHIHGSSKKLSPHPLWPHFPIECEQTHIHGNLRPYCPSQRWPCLRRVLRAMTPKDDHPLLGRAQSGKEWQAGTSFHEPHRTSRFQRTDGRDWKNVSKHQIELDLSVLNCCTARKPVWRVFMTTLKLVGQEVVCARLKNSSSIELQNDSIPNANAPQISTLRFKNQIPSEIPQIHGSQIPFPWPAMCLT